MHFEGDSINQVFDSYCEYLAATQDLRFTKDFIIKWRQDPEPKLAEALVFAWARAAHLNPAVNESLTRGGLDFRCAPDIGSPFLLEVTTLRVSTVERHSNVSNDPAHLGGWFSLITRGLNMQVRAKWSQFERSEPIPRVIAIASLHTMSGVLLGRHAAESLLISDQFINHPITEEGLGEGRPATDLKNSAFLRLDDKNPPNIVVKNRVVSAILLFPILADRVHPLGILHPEPQYPFDIRGLHLVPIVAVRDWPLRNHQISMQWTYETDPAVYYHRRIRLTDEERGIKNS